jgi:hypothetical protein
MDTDHENYMEHSHILCGPTALFFDDTAGDKVTTVIGGIGVCTFQVIGGIGVCTFQLFECFDLSCYFEEMRRYSLVPVCARASLCV